MVTVSTKTFYAYVHQGRTSIKPIDLPRMVRRKTKRTGSHTFQKDRKALPLQKDPNISRIEKNSDIGKVILSLDLEMDRMVHILLSLKERHASTI